MEIEKLNGVANVAIASPRYAIKNGPEVDSARAMWVSMDELAGMTGTPQVRHARTEDLPIQGGGTVRAHLFTVAGALVEGMGYLMIMGDHYSAAQAEALAQRGLEESIEDYRSYMDAARGPELSLSVIENGMEREHVVI